MRVWDWRGSSLGIVLAYRARKEYHIIPFWCDGILSVLPAFHWRWRQEDWKLKSVLSYYDLRPDIGLGDMENLGLKYSDLIGILCLLVSQKPVPNLHNLRAS